MGVCGQVSKVVPVKQEQKDGLNSFFKPSTASTSPVSDTTTTSGPAKAWKVTFLPCDGSCELAERNKRLAEAFDIDPAGGRHSLLAHADETVPIEYPESMLVFAKANTTFVKVLEKELETFMLDRTRKTARLFNNGKRTYLAFANRLSAQFYELDSEIEDADTKAPGLFLKKKATSRIPATLISEAATNPKKAKPAAKATSAIPGGLAFNAIHLVGVQWGIDSRSITILLEPLFGTSFGHPVIHWNSEDDLVVTVKTLSSSTDPAEVESFLRQIRQSVADKFVGNGYAKEVKLCWVDRSMTIRDEEGMKKGEALTPTSVTLAEPAPVDTRNQFELLGDTTDKPKGDSWGDGEEGKDEDAAETWEELVE